MQAKPVKAVARKRRHPAVGWAIGLVLGALALWLMGKFFSLKSEPEPQRKVQQIAVLRPPPPPKPPEKPPEPQKVKEEVKLDEPKPVDEPKPADSPKSDPPPDTLAGAREGSGPGDGFGMSGGANRAPVIGGGGGGGMSQTLFANNVARHIAQELARLGALRNIEYRVDLRVWLGRDGRIERSEITRGSGDPEVDRLVAEGLTRIGALRQPPPDGMAQPLRIRLTSADA